MTRKKDAKSALDAAAGKYTVDGIDITTIEDSSIFIESALSEVKKEALIGGLLSILIIFFFLRDGWSTLVIGLSLPISIITTFFFMDQLGLSLNVMSLAGLALATGMVVDDSIVVLESIAKARERGLGILDAAIKGAGEVSMAVVASTLTTVAVFFPLVFVEGVAGQLFKDQALTVSIALLISLIVSLTLIPDAFFTESEFANGFYRGRKGSGHCQNQDAAIMGRFESAASVSFGYNMAQAAGLHGIFAVFTLQADCRSGLLDRSLAQYRLSIPGFRHHLGNRERVTLG